MLLSCYYIGDRLRDDEKNSIMAEARRAYIIYRQIYTGVHSVLDKDVLELHGEVRNGLPSNRGQHRNDVCGIGERTGDIAVQAG